MAGEERPVVAVTIGDAAGIGPEVVAKALLNKSLFDICRPLVIGSGSVMQAVVDRTGRSLKLRPVASPAEARGEPCTVDLLDLHNLKQEDVTVGQISAACGRAAMEYIARAYELALASTIKAIVTAPINKEATKLGGYGDVGHLEFLARLTGTKEYATMLVSGCLRTVHLTTHYSLREACDKVTKERVLARLKLTHKSFQDWGFTQPRIAVAALNPHAGEGGLFGDEETNEIIPAVREAQVLGIDARGPFPADSVFNRAINGEFDVVLAMYHDQGHIPVKVFGFEKSVSVALGLPFVRTSVDHGTAFDIAGKGIANAESMEESIRVAVTLVEGKGLSDKH